MNASSSEEADPVQLVNFRISRAVSMVTRGSLRRSATFAKNSASTKNIVSAGKGTTDREFKWKIYRNVFVLSFAILFVFAGIVPLSTIQSSMNASKGMGTASLSVHTAAMVIEALFFNSLLSGKLGVKWSLLVGILLEAVYIGGNLYPRWWTLIPAALVSGFGRPLLRTAEATYLTVAATIYAKRLKLKESEIKTRFFSFFYIFYCSSRVVGNVMSSLILGSGIEKFSVTYIKQFMAETNVSLQNEHCGADFCQGDETVSVVPLLGNSSFSANATAAPPVKMVSDQLLYELCGYSFGCLIVGAGIILFFLQPTEELATKGEGDDVEEKDEGIEEGVDDSVSPEVIEKPFEFLLTTVRNWKNPKQLLLIPLSVYNGMDNSFWQADFTKAFVTCTVGIHWVGFIVAWYGLTAPIVVLLFNFVKIRPVPLTVAFIAHLGTAVAMLYWKPSVSELPVLFGLSAAWGVGSGLWPYSVTAFYAIVFSDNLPAGFSNYWLFDSLGGTLSYAWSYSLCTWVKTVVLIAIMTTGFCGYVIVEILLLLEKRKDLLSEIKSKDIDKATFPKK